MSEKDLARIVMHIWLAACVVYFETEWLLIGMVVLSCSIILLFAFESVIRRIGNGNKEG